MRSCSARTDVPPCALAECGSSPLPYETTYVNALKKEPMH